MIKMRRKYIYVLLLNLLFYIILFLNYGNAFYGEITLLIIFITTYECQMQRIMKMCNIEKESECDNKVWYNMEIFPLVIAIIIAVYGGLNKCILISLLPIFIVGVFIIFLLKRINRNGFMN